MSFEIEQRACRAMLRAFYDVGSFNIPGNTKESGGEWSICDFLREQNPEIADSYLEEKAATWRRSPHQLVMSFDRERFAAFVAWCINHFADK